MLPSPCIDVSELKCTNHKGLSLYRHTVSDIFFFYNLEFKTKMLMLARSPAYVLDSLML